VLIVETMPPPRCTGRRRFTSLVRWWAKGSAAHRRDVGPAGGAVGL